MRCFEEGIIMAKKITSKKTRSANNRPNCLKVTKRTQKVNLQTITIDGKKYRTSAREARALKNAA
jgi:ribosomal protein L28